MAKKRPTHPVKRVKRLKLAELLKKRGVTSYTVAKAIKVSPNTLKSYERGIEREPYHSMIVNLMAYFELENEEELIEYEDESEEEAACLLPV